MSVHTTAGFLISRLWGTETSGRKCCKARTSRRTSAISNTSPPQYRSSRRVWGGEVFEIADVRLLVRALQHFLPEVSVPQSRLIKNPAVVCTDMDEGGVLLDLETTAYYSLNRSALRVWSLLDDAPTLDEIAARLTSEFDIDYEH